MYVGSWKIDDLLTFYANTHNASTGAATDADSAPSYRVYEDETGTPILTGSMALIDSANTVGFYSEQITLSAANGFEKGKTYSVYIAATVSSVTGTMHHFWQIEAEVDSNAVSNLNANVITATSINADAITAAKVADDVSTEIANKTLDTDMTAHQTQGTLGQAIGDPGADTDSIWALANTNLDATVGSRVAATDTRAIAWSGGVTFSNAAGNALTLSSSGGNGHGLAITANGSGRGISSTGGATGHGIQAIGGATSGDGINITASTSGHGISVTAVGTTKHGIVATGGSTSSDGIRSLGGGSGHGLNLLAGSTGHGMNAQGGSTSGDGINAVGPTLGNGIAATATGSSKHGVVATGGTAGVSDGVKCVAGTGGVDLRANITGNVSGSVGSVTIVSDKTGYQLSAAGVDDILDDVIEGTTTLRAALRGYSAALLSKASGLATTTAVFRDIGDTKDRITATVDSNGNRTAITLDLT